MVEPLADPWWKRPFDVAFALFALLILSPVMILSAVLVKLTSRGPVFFTQERAGRGGRPFRVWKFRTMVPGAESMGAGLSVAKDDDRITAAGRWLRRFSVDELPQLLNVIGGSMSVVGPRPLPTRYVERYSPRQRTRLAVKPGITGWAQVRGRNIGTWEERLELDAWYVENRSFLVDVRILFATPLVMLLGTGVEGEGGGVKEFTGRPGPGASEGEMP